MTLIIKIAKAPNLVCGEITICNKNDDNSTTTIINKPHKKILPKCNHVSEKSKRAYFLSRQKLQITASSNAMAVLKIAAAVWNTIINWALSITFKTAGGKMAEPASFCLSIPC